MDKILFIKTGVVTLTFFFFGSGFIKIIFIYLIKTGFCPIKKVDKIKIHKNSWNI